MNFKYLAIGIAVGYLTPYLMALIKTKSADTQSKDTSQSETLFESNY